MANKEYYERWLQIKSDINKVLLEDARLQYFAEAEIGLKPQSTAVEVVARVYAKYCTLFNNLCDAYDQMQQPQRAEYMRKIIDAMTCRILELKQTLQKVEAFEITYPDNALQQLIMIPQDIQIMVPFFYSYETRQAEMQYIADQILAGNRLGDPPITEEQLQRLEEERIEKERLEQEEKEAELKRNMAFGEEIFVSKVVIQLSPKEMEEIRLREEYNQHLFNIQRMERSRITLREKNKKKNKEEDLYLYLAGLKKPKAKEMLRFKATRLIQDIYRIFMDIKRKHKREDRLKQMIDMTIPSWSSPTNMIQLEKVKEVRREFRRNYYQKWIEATIKEKARVLRLREHDIMEDISDHIREWFLNWYSTFKIFDEFPYPGEGGSILIVRGETMTLEEYIGFQEKEIKRLKAEGSNPKSKEQIKLEKAFAKEEKKRLAKEQADRDKKRLLDYKKSRLNPVNDPGVRLKKVNNLTPLLKQWESYENQWKAIDAINPSLDVIRSYIMALVTENVFKDVHLELRPIVDEAMRLELALLKAANVADYKSIEKKMPPVQKRKKPPRGKKVKPDRIRPEKMFQELADKGIVRKYPKTSLEDFWADCNYAAADTRAIPWVPTFPPPCLGDIKEHVRVQCLLTLGSSCNDAIRSQLIIGPKNSGKKTLVYAVASESNSILIDLSPANTRGKYPGKKLKRMMLLVNRISRLMQPTVILVENADQIFYKRIPKEEKHADPTQLQKNFYKDIVKPLKGNDKILVLGTANTPWVAKKTITKAFNAIIMMPTTDYGSISFILTKLLMTYHGVDREFDVHSTAQCLRGYDIQSIKKAVNTLMDSKRIAALAYKPLHPKELLSLVINDPEAVLTTPEDFRQYQDWYLRNSPWGSDYEDMMIMLETQLIMKLKNEKKPKPKKKAED